MERWGHTPWDGGVSDALEKSYSPAVLLIDRKSTRSSDEVSEKNSYHQTFRRSPNCVVQQTINVTVSA